MGGDQHLAVDALLAMSDPDHVPVPQQAAATEQPSQVRHIIQTSTSTKLTYLPTCLLVLRTPHTPHTPPLPLSTKAEQTQLDEEFARQLLLEDEQQYARDQIALRQQQQQEQMRQFPYAQRRGSHPTIPRGDAVQQQPQPQPQRDTMSDMQEQFSKIAESTYRFPPSHPLEILSCAPLMALIGHSPHRAHGTYCDIFSFYFVAGKRTFSSLVSKVKAKVQEFDQQRYAGSLPSPPVTHSFTHTSTFYRNTPNTEPSGSGTSTDTGYDVAQLPSPGLDRHAQQAYYAPRVSPNSQPGTNNNFES